MCALLTLLQQVFLQRKFVYYSNLPTFTRFLFVYFRVFNYEDIFIGVSAFKNPTVGARADAVPKQGQVVRLALQLNSLMTFWTNRYFCIKFCTLKQ